MSASTKVKSKYINKEEINMLTKKISEGDCESGALLYDLMRYPIFKHIKSFVKNAQDSEDILQDVFLIYLKKTRNKLHYKNCFGLLFKITDRQISKYFRNNQKSELIMDNELYLNDDIIKDSEENYIFSLIIFNLTERQKQIVELRTFGYRDKEIAGKLNISISTIRRELIEIKNMYDKLKM